jgi:hypothetical protein
MLSNLPALKIVSTLTMFINSQRRFMGSSKPQEHGMNACVISLSPMASKSVKPILLSLLKLLQKICLYAKFMLLISYLGLLTNLLAKSLVGSDSAYSPTSRQLSSTLTTFSSRAQTLFRISRTNSYYIKTIMVCLFSLHFEELEFN